MPFRPTAEGLTLSVRLTPKARDTRILGIADGEDMTRVLKISVNAVPENGAANKALIEHLAKTWKLPKTSFSLLHGHTSRNKTLLIRGDTKTLQDQISKQTPDLF